MGTTWTRAGENLIRHGAGNYYLRAKVLGKIFPECLDTDDLRIAKLKRDDRLAAIRAARQAEVAGEGKGAKVRTLADAVNVLQSEMLDRPGIEEKTKAYCRDVLRILRDTLPVTVHARTWSAGEARAWWSKVGTRYSASVANKVLAAGKRLAGIIIEAGERSDDPTRGLARIRERRKARTLPDVAGMEAIIKHIRTCKKRNAVISAQFVAVAAFSGMRKGEVAAITWDGVGTDWLLVGADGDTKGKTFRRVPMNPRLRAVFDEIRAEYAPEEPTGRVFMMSSPRRALHTACAALKFPDMRVHDLRHFFATWCIESGIDIPTVSKWLGHKDGGALAMRTYGHVRDDHSLEAVRKLG